MLIFDNHIVLTPSHLLLRLLWESSARLLLFLLNLHGLILLANWNHLLSMIILRSWHDLIVEWIIVKRGWIDHRIWQCSSQISHLGGSSLTRCGRRCRRCRSHLLLLMMVIETWSFVYFFGIIAIWVRNFSRNCIWALLSVRVCLHHHELRAITLGFRPICVVILGVFFVAFEDRNVCTLVGGGNWLVLILSGIGDNFCRIRDCHCLRATCESEHRLFKALGLLRCRWCVLSWDWHSLLRRCSDWRLGVICQKLISLRGLKNKAFHTIPRFYTFLLITFGAVLERFD